MEQKLNCLYFPAQREREKKQHAVKVRDGVEV